MPFSLYSPTDTPRKKSLPQRFPVLAPIIVLITLVIGISLFRGNSGSPKIGVIELEGIILESEPFIRKLRQLENDPSVRGIIIRVNSPGGAVSPTQEIFSELVRLRKKMTVVTSVSSTAASGGYYVSIGTKKIYANPGSSVGSIGVIIRTFNVEKLMNKFGVQTEVIKSGKNKDVGSAFRRMTASEKKMLKSLISDTHEQFVMAIADNRPMKLAIIRQLADGSIFNGRQALKHGFIDGLASFREVVELLRNELKIDQPVELFYPTDRDELLKSILDVESFFPIKKVSLHTGLFYLSTAF
jgi:protease-4